MTPARFIKCDHKIINVKDLRNISLIPEEHNFKFEYGADKTALITVGTDRAYNQRKALWEYSCACLCEFLSAIQNEKTGCTLLFDFNKIFAAFKHEEEEEIKEFEELM